MRHRRRYIPPGGALVAITHRCLQARLLLTPSRRLNEILLGVLAMALLRSGAKLCDIVVLGNHLHILLWVQDAQQMASCMEFFAGNLAREVGRLRRWKGKFWDGQYSAIVVADDDASQIQRLHYLMQHGCKEDLVAKPQQWPGIHPAKLRLADAAPTGVWVDRTALHHARLKNPERDFQEADFEKRIPIELWPLPCWAHLSPDEYRQRVQQMVQEIETETAARHQRERKRPAGRKEVLSQNPRKQPKRPKKSTAPLIHATSRRVREEFKAAYRAVMEAYSIASAKLRQGDRTVRFPEGTFPPALAFVPHSLQPRAG